ncbi:hypothetical protein [Streptomyces murinus]|uniref:hypothetical protein n=1 Tax=Streptomyces murinus TaxID=33900 RepID=UPI003F465170
MAPLFAPTPKRRHRYPADCGSRTGALAGVMYVLRTGVAWRDVPAGTIGCSGATARRRLRDRTGTGVRPRLHAALLTELRRADLLDLDDCAVDGSRVRTLSGTAVPPGNGRAPGSKNMTPAWRGHSHGPPQPLPIPRAWTPRSTTSRP